MTSSPKKPLWFDSRTSTSLNRPVRLHFGWSITTLITMYVSISLFHFQPAMKQSMGKSSVEIILLLLTKKHTVEKADEKETVYITHCLFWVWL